MRRKIYDRLLEWKKGDGKSAALIEGARRIGKSYIVEEFAKREYKSYILIDFSIASDDIKDLFYDQLSDLDTFFMYLSTLYNTKLYQRESVIIFDEVQLFPKAREAIKHLVADGRYDYIETGSLISIKENVKDILIPSEEKKIQMYPMDLEEFMWALNEEMLYEQMRDHFINRIPMGPLHKKAMNIFRQYLIVGGMPDPVKLFIKTRDFNEVDEAKRMILDLYRNDINKYSNDRSYIQAIFDDIPGQLSKHEKKFIYSSVDGSKYRDLYGAFEWLKESMIVNICYKTTEPNIGLKMNLDKVSLKCYMGDTGLLISMAFDEKGLIDEEIYNKLLTDKLEVNKGMLIENIVAQILVNSGHKLYYYSSYDKQNKDNRMEIDFLIAKKKITNRHNIIPIEVKSGTYNVHPSLDKFMHKYDEYIYDPCVLHKGDLKIQSPITYLPIYFTPFL